MKMSIPNRIGKLGVCLLILSVPSYGADLNDGFQSEEGVMTSMDLVVKPPMIVSGQQNVWISNVRISNPNGPCLQITGSKNVQIVNSEIGPCAGAGIQISGSTLVKSNFVLVHDTTGNAFDVSNSTDVRIEQNTVSGGASGVYAYNSKQVKVIKNSFLNIQGPRPRAQLVQFNRVSGGGNRIACNTGVNLLKMTNPEDAINLYVSNGVAGDPIQVVGNRIYGGGPSTSGGGIILGDGSGSYQVARDNVLVNPGQYGVSVAGGNNMQMIGNQVFSTSFSWNNVGLYVWNQYTPACFGITVQGNRVNYLGKNGSPNGAWDGKNCGAITGWNQNNFNDTSLTEAVFQTYTSPECK